MSITTDHSIVVLDGGFSSQISRYNKSFEGHPLWSSLLLQKHPDLVFQTHLDYLQAGSDIITTNTYQASIEAFKTNLNLKTDDECLELIEAAVKLAQGARDCYSQECSFKKLAPRNILVAGSVGPYGASLNDGSEYNGNYVNSITIEQMRQWHIPRIETLIKAGVDLLAFETIPASVEAVMLVELLKNYKDMKAWLSFSCKDEQHTSFGEEFQVVAKMCYDLNPEQLIAIGINCTKPEFIVPLIHGINDDREGNEIPIIVYPNSGEDYDKQKGWINKGNCEPFESYVATWIDLGVKYIGGCCRTYEEEIGVIRTEADKYMNEH